MYYWVFVEFLDFSFVLRLSCGIFCAISFLVPSYCIDYLGLPLIMLNVMNY